MTSQNRSIRLDNRYYFAYLNSDKLISLSNLAEWSIQAYFNVEEQIKVIDKQIQELEGKKQEIIIQSLKERLANEIAVRKSDTEFSLENLSEIQTKLKEWIDSGFAKSEKELGRNGTIPNIDSCRKVANKYASNNLFMKNYNFDKVDKGFAEWYLKQKQN